MLNEPRGVLPDALRRATRFTFPIPGKTPFTGLLQGIVSLFAKKPRRADYKANEVVDENCAGIQAEIEDWWAANPPHVSITDLDYRMRLGCHFCNADNSPLFRQVQNKWSLHHNADWKNNAGRDVPLLDDWCDQWTQRHCTGTINSRGISPGVQASSSYGNATQYLAERDGFATVTGNASLSRIQPRKGPNPWKHKCEKFPGLLENTLQYGDMRKNAKCMDSKDWNIFHENGCWAQGP